jgi:hypothetical protein
MNNTIGKAFEELETDEMYAINGGAAPATPTLTSVTPWSSAPCTVGIGVVSLCSVVGTIIYTFCK